MRFSSVREAKEWVIAAIVQEAATQGVPLSETERRMLRVADVEEDVDVDAYETRIAGLIRAARKRGGKDT